MRILMVLILSLFFIGAYAEDFSTPLPPDKAFRLESKLVNHDLVLSWKMSKNVFLYKNSIQVTSTPGALIKPGAIHLPKGIARQDEVHGKYEIYTNTLTIKLPLIGSLDGVANIAVHYQGCSSQGFCYAPIQKLLKIDFTQQPAEISVIKYDSLAKLIDAPLKSKQEKVTEIFHSHHPLVILLIFLGMGILLAFTPCVLPMIPILSGIIAGQQKITSKKAFSLSTFYVLGMSITYAFIGILVAYLGKGIQAYTEQPWVIFLVASLFVLLSLSLFGFYELGLPSSWQTKLNQLSNKQKGGHYLGVFLMGALSALVVSPCVTAPLVGILAYIAQTGNLFFGGLVLFVLAWGMGVPLILVGTSCGKFLPRAGAWMDNIKKLFGLLLLGVAVVLVARVWHPAYSNQNLPFTLIQNSAQLTTALNNAKNSQPTILDFYADWCSSCIEMDKKVWNKKQVKTAVANMKMLRVDLTHNLPTDEAIMKAFNLVGPPAVLFFDKNGNEIKGLRIVEGVNANELLMHLKILNESNK